MSFLKRLFGGGSREYAMVVELGKVGPIGEEMLRAIADDVVSRLIDRHESLLSSVQPAISLDVGGIHLKIETVKITKEQAQEIARFAQECYKEYLLRQLDLLRQSGRTGSE